MPRFAVGVYWLCVVSGKLALDTEQNALWNLVVGFLPESIRKDTRRVRHFLVMDLSAK